MQLSWLETHSTQQCYLMESLRQKSGIIIRSPQPIAQDSFIHSLKVTLLQPQPLLQVGFPGLFPKSLLQILYQYAREVDKSGHSKDEFKTLVNKLVTAFMYRPIIIQKIIQMMLSKMKDIIMEENHENPTIDNSNESKEFASSKSVGNTPCASQILSPPANNHVK